MTLEGAKIELERLRGIASNGGDLAQHKREIAELYYLTTGKALRECRCKNVLTDALAEIYAKLKTITKMQIERKAKMVCGVVLQWQGNHYTNANITDDVARAFLAQFPERKDWFEILPEDAEGKTPAKDVEVPAAEAVTPKKKKTAKKRK